MQRAKISLLLLTLTSLLQISPSLGDSCECGKSEYESISCGGRQGRIIGGRRAKENEIPWQVSVESCQFGICENLCGGSIIGKKYILTAAHCLHSTTPKIKVIVGTVDLEKNASSPHKRVYSVASVIKSENWNPVGAKGDIALIRLGQNIEFNPSVRPVCLPSNQENLFVQKSAIVSGWGYTSEDSYYPSSSLRRALLHITSNDDIKCRNTDPGGKTLPIEYLCAHGVDSDACHLDSGGPLSVLENGTCSLVGIVSYGRGCARKDIAGVYTRISEYLDWIRENTLDDDCLNN